MIVTSYFYQGGEEFPWSFGILSLIFMDPHKNKRRLTQLLAKDVLFVLTDECLEVFTEHSRLLFLPLSSNHQNGGSLLGSCAISMTMQLEQRKDKKP